MRIKFVTRNRLVILALLLFIAAGFMAVVSIVDGIIHAEKKAEKTLVQQKIREVFDSVGMMAGEYVQARKRVRDKARESLQQQGITLLGDVQVFLQAAVIKREADVAQEELREVRKKRELLAAFALQRFSSLTREMLRMKQDVTRMQSNLDNLLADAQQRAGSMPQTAVGVPVADAAELPELLAQIKTRNIQNSKKFREQGSITAKNEVTKLRELRRYLDDKTDTKQIDFVGLLTNLSPDLVNLLPEGVILNITEAGGKVLLNLGKDLPAGGINAEVSRALILQLPAERRQLVLSLYLHDSRVEPEANISELAEVLQQHISRVLGGNGFSGYIYGARHELLKFFPEDAGVKPSLPEKGWNKVASSGILTYYEEYNSDLLGFDFTVGLCYELKNISVEERISRIVAENPSKAVLLVVLLLVIFFAVILIALVAWKGSSGFGSNSAQILTEGIDIRRIKPELGSLARLQKINRGHNAGGSRILDYTRNQALQELVNRIRSGGGNTGESSRGLRSKGSETGHKSGLREYMK